MSWSTEDRRWTVDVTRADTGERLRFTADFLWMCQGYYNHEKPYQPRWEGMDRFQGRIVHPQQWPDDLDYTGKRVVVIGSGATAATLVPAIGEDGGARDDAAALAVLLRRRADDPRARRHAGAAGHPAGVDARDPAPPVPRRSTTGWPRRSLTAPDEVHAFLMEGIRPLLPEGYDIEKHFTPHYRPWQQRIAIVPDGDFFAAIREGKASIVTDTIEEFTENGIRLGSGEELEADVVVTATGFNLSVFGEIPFTVDGEAVDFADRVTWRGLMISGVPNMAYMFGYFRHSWTLRVDLVSDLVLRLLENMALKDATMVTPTLRAEDADMEIKPWSDPENFNAGYVMRSQHVLFKQGDREPWKHMQEHDEEQELLPKADLDDGSLVYR